MCDAGFSLRPEITHWVILQASRKSRHARPRGTLVFSIYGLGISGYWPDARNRLQWMAVSVRNGL